MRIVFRAPKRHLAVLTASLCSVLLPRLALGADPMPPNRVEPCSLLDNDEVRGIQGQEVVEAIVSVSDGGSFHVFQCVYRTDDLVHSVSLALSLPDGRGEEAGAARTYWMERFHEESVEAETAELEEEEEAGPPVLVPGVGEEAFWVGDGRTGALYVLYGEGFLRLSVGGVPDAAERRERTVDLAEVALPRVAAAATR